MANASNGASTKALQPALRRPGGRAGTAWRLCPLRRRMQRGVVAGARGWPIGRWPRRLGEIDRAGFATDRTARNDWTGSDGAVWLRRHAPDDAVAADAATVPTRQTPSRRLHALCPLPARRDRVRRDRLQVGAARPCVRPVRRPFGGRAGGPVAAGDRLLPRRRLGLGQPQPVPVALGASRFARHGRLHRRVPAEEDRRRSRRRLRPRRLGRLGAHRRPCRRIRHRPGPHRRRRRFGRRTPGGMPRHRGLPAG